MLVFEIVGNIFEVGDIIKILMNDYDVVVWL